MNKESSSYTFIYAAILVIIVAAALSIASGVLEPYQKRNVEIEKKKNILSSVNKLTGYEQSKDKNAFVLSAYKQYMTTSFVLNSRGDIISGDAFGIDLAVELKKPEAARALPVFVCVEKNGERRFVFPVRGTGLWGPIWGYIALNEDFNTIYGTNFAHKGETPGLGAEISTLEFQQQFQQKKLFEGDRFVSIRVMKGGAPAGDVHAVDAISGGTITSVGVQKMIEDRMRAYLPYIKKVVEQRRIAAEAVSGDSIQLK